MEAMISRAFMFLYLYLHVMSAELNLKSGDMIIIAIPPPNLTILPLCLRSYDEKNSNFELWPRHFMVMTTLFTPRAYTFR